jgi:hypothetical protein
VPCASIPPLLIGLDALVGLGETTTPPVVWTCRARRHVAFPPPAAIAILSFPSAEGKGVTASQHRGGAMGSEFRGDATGLPLSCCLLPPRGFVFCQTCCPCIQQAQPTPAVCRALSPLLLQPMPAVGRAELRATGGSCGATASGTRAGAHRMNVWSLHVRSAPTLGSLRPYSSVSN